MGRLQVLVLKHLMHSISFRIFLSNMGRLRVLEFVAEKAPLSLPSSNSLFSWCLKGKTNIWRQASIRGDMSYLLSSVSIIYSLLSLSRIYHYIVISFCWWCLKGKTNISRQASIRGDMSSLLSCSIIIYSLLSLSRIYHYIGYRILLVVLERED